MMTAPAPSFDTCLALAASGFPQQTLFTWVGRGPLSAPVLKSRRPASTSRRAALAAPTLGEVLAQLPATLVCAVPHPIYGTVERAHSLHMRIGERTEFGYHLPGSFDVKHRTEHARAVEAAARLFMKLRTSGELAAPQATRAPTAKPLARAA